eukprot:01935_2
MYREFCPVRPEEKWWSEQQHEGLQQRILKAKSTIQDDPPQEFMHLKINYKRKVQEREKQRQIEKEAERINSRISTISGMRNEQKQTTPRTKSMIESYQKKEAERIYRENLALFARLQSKKSCYNRLEAERQYQQSQVYARQISTFTYTTPRKPYRPRHLEPLSLDSEG